MADRGKEGTTMYQKNGLLYWILDDKGNKIGVPIKASALVSRPTIRNLQSTFQANEQVRRIYKERLITGIDSFFDATDRQTRADFCDYLNVRGINPVFRENKDGLVYGITFIDNRKGAVINGSDLGKEYSGRALVKRFHEVAPSEKERQIRVEQRFYSAQLEQYDHSQPNRMQDLSLKLLALIKPEKPYSEPINPYLKRRRKRRRGLSR